MTSPLIDIRDLRLATSATPSRDLLKGLSLTLRAGEVLGIIGESGAGKSTLGLAALGHLRAGVRHAGGQVLYRGQDLLAMPLAQRNRLLGRKLTYVAQSASAAFNPAYTLGRQMTETLVRDGMPREAARQRMVALLRKLDLPDPEHFGERYPHQVSGGQLQRAMTVMAMVSEPEMVVFDEPTTALDVTVQAQILDLLRRLQQESGMSILFVTHNLGVVAEIAHRVAVMYAGRVVEDADVYSLFERPTHPYTRGLLSCIPTAALLASRQRLQAIPGNVPSVLSLPPGCTFAPRCPLADEGCAAAVPELLAVQPAHRARCFKVAAA